MNIQNIQNVQNGGKVYYILKDHINNNLIKIIQKYNIIDKKIIDKKNIINLKYNFKMSYNEINFVKSYFKLLEYCNYRFKILDDTNLLDDNRFR